MPEFSFSDHTLNIERRELRRGAEPVAVEPQVFDLIAHLVQNRDRVLSKDDLIAAVWDGRIVSDSTLATRINAARRALGDSGEEQRLIRTYPRKGIRFVGEVREMAEGGAPAETAAPGPGPAPRGKPCVAVLPFENLSSDPEQDYFSEGVTEDIITALSKHRSILVVARNPSFALKARGADVRMIGSAVGANYVVQGSVRRLGTRIRVSAQLVEAETGGQLWGEQYDRELRDIFDLQYEIAATLAARIAPEIESVERAHTERKSPAAFEAWDYFRLGTKHFYKSTADDNREAERLFRRAIEIDPFLAAAYGFLSYSLVLSMTYFETEPDDRLIDEAAAIARRGVDLDGRDALIRFMYGRALLARKSYREALDELTLAAELNPSLAPVYCGLGDSLVYAGRISESIPHFERAIALSPHDPLRWAFYAYRAQAHLFARQFELAEEWARRATQVPNCHYLAFAHHVAALGFLDRPEELATALAELRREKPDFSCELAERRLFYLKDPEQTALYLEGLRRAGVAARSM